MFTAKLNSGATLAVNQVDERYTMRSGEGDATLTLRIAEKGQSLDHYTVLLSADHALDKITITDENGVENVYTQYIYINSISRSLVTGGANIQIVLTRAVKDDE